VSDTNLELEAAAEAIVFAHEAEVAAIRPAPAAAALERSAALAAAAFAGAAPVPEALQRRLAAAGLAFCAERAQGPATATTTRRPFLWPLVAAAAAAVAIWFALRTGSPTDRPAEERRAEIVAADAAAKTLPWKKGPSPMSGDVEGDVVWSSNRQEGWLRFRGLPPLDAEHRYQLWIVDARREGAPVDGGLFAIGDSAGETLVPVRATLPIGEAKAFVVTVESRHGVVVSKQEHVVAIAGL